MKELNLVKNSIQTKWWCVHFGQDAMNPLVQKKLIFFLKRYSAHRVSGKNRIFLDMSESKGSYSFPLFQKKLYEMAERLGLAPETWSWGMGVSLSEAWVHARWRTTALEVLPVEAISDFLNPLELGKVSAIQIRRIHQLKSRGISSLQDLIDLPEAVLEAQGGVWIAEFARDYFERPESRRDACLERVTTASFLKSGFESSSIAFQLEDWIPDEYLRVS